MPTRDIIEQMIGLFVREVIGTRRKDVIRLIIAEGSRFPKLAEFHYREVLSRVMAAMSALMARAIARGEVKNPGLCEISAIDGGAGPRRRDLERIVRTFRAARCRRHDARASRYYFRRKESAMMFYRIASKIILAPLIGAALLLAACSKEAENEFQGWIEADLIFISPDEQGRVETMMVREGDRVEQGTPLFTLDSDLQRADLAVAEAAVINTKQAFDRAQQLLKVASGTQRDFDVTQAAYRQADAQLGAAQTRLDRRKLSSPVAGVIQQIYFRPGETVPASRPIMAVLPPGNIKVRFFIPERMLARIAIGDQVRVTCDGCANNITAPVTFISRNAEFTPPVIYSLEERSKLVYLVEARPAQTEMLRVGQPVSVEVKLREAPK